MQPESPSGCSTLSLLPVPVRRVVVKIYLKQLLNTPSNTARIVLVDDHPEVLRQTRELLEPQFEVVETLANGSQVEAAVARTHPDLLLLDITLPLVNGIEIATRLVRAGIAPRIVFLTVHEDVDYARAAMAAGAQGYVVKSRLASDLIPALHAALLGQKFVSPVPALSQAGGDLPGPSP